MKYLQFLLDRVLVSSMNWVNTLLGNMLFFPEQLCQHPPWEGCLDQLGQLWNLPATSIELRQSGFWFGWQNLLPAESVE